MGHFSGIVSGKPRSQIVRYADIAAIAHIDGLQDIHVLHRRPAFALHRLAEPERP
jgi:hypothetical protein